MGVSGALLQSCSQEQAREQRAAQAVAARDMANRVLKGQLQDLHRQEQAHEAAVGAVLKVAQAKVREVHSVQVVPSAGMLGSPRTTYADCSKEIPADEADAYRSGLYRLRSVQREDPNGGPSSPSGEVPGAAGDPPEVPQAAHP